MRLYTFINFYLSQIQQGIQTAHIVHELFNQYRCDIDVPNPFAAEGGHVLSGHLLDDWSRNHRTIIVLNAGADEQIQELMDIFKAYEFPFTQFVEDQGLCHARTGCGVVLPEWIYSAERVFDHTTKTHIYRVVNGSDLLDSVYYPGDKYFDLIDAVKSKRLA